MKKWQSTIINHHNEAIVINESQVKIPNIGYSTISNESYDEVITREEDGSYFIESFIHNTSDRVDTYATETIREYLGY